MVVERTSDEIIIRLPATLDTEDLQDLLNYMRYKELTKSLKVQQSEVDELSNEINKTWWDENHEQLLK